jgi:hypothetical protein
MNRSGKPKNLGEGGLGESAPMLLRHPELNPDIRDEKPTSTSLSYCMALSFTKDI